MAPPQPTTFLIFLPLLFHVSHSAPATFTITNLCSHTVWPGVLSSAGRPPLLTTGFELPSGASRSLLAPPGWSGRFWGRTGCALDPAGRFYCSTGDCGSGQMECAGAGAEPPATLAEFTLGGQQDFYDVSLVDGYNLPMVVQAVAGSGACAATGCPVDLNRACPPELRAGGGEACRSACEAFGRPEYCCSGEFGSPATCRPSVYSAMFKAACPRSYSYAYDDATSTFTCTGGDYDITFCPSSRPSQKSYTATSTTPTVAAAGVTMLDNGAGLQGSFASSGAASNVRKASLLQWTAATTCILVARLLSL